MSRSVGKIEKAKGSEQELAQARSAVENLEKLYKLREREEVVSFISNNLFLVPLLDEAHSRIKYYFPDAHLYLERFSELEAPDES